MVGEWLGLSHGSLDRIHIRKYFPIVIGHKLAFLVSMMGQTSN